MPPAADDPMTLLLALMAAIPVGLWPGIGGLVLIVGSEAYYAYLSLVWGKLVGGMILAVAPVVGAIFGLIVGVCGMMIVGVVGTVLIVVVVRSVSASADARS